MLRASTTQDTQAPRATLPKLPRRVSCNGPWGTVPRQSLQVATPGSSPDLKMVFCGKPSKGCGECRPRKIRCDQGRPTCSQCAKGNRACPSYQDELSLMFRDESEQVVRKAKTDLSGRRNKKPAARAAYKKSSPSVLLESRGSSSTESPAASSSLGKESPSVVSTSSPPINFGSDFAGLNEIEEVQLINREQLLQQDLVYTPCNVQPSWQLTVDEAVNYFLRHNVWPEAVFMNFEPKSPWHPSATLSEQAQMTALISVGTAMLSWVRRSKDLELPSVSDDQFYCNLTLRRAC